jgi:tetratricopeptide (TPR) repeat protein
MLRTSAAVFMSHYRNDELPLKGRRTRRGAGISWLRAGFALVVMAVGTVCRGQGRDGTDVAPVRDAERNLLANLERVRSATPDHFSPERFDREMAAAFRTYGLDLDHAEPKEAGARLAGRPSTPTIVAAIDDWCRARIDLEITTWRRLDRVARAADPDPWRNSLRDQHERPPAEAIPALRARAAEVVAMEKQPLPSLLLLTRMLFDAGEPATSTPVLYLAERRFPDEFWVCFQQGNLNILGAPEPDPTEAVRYLKRAVALRPRSFAAHASLANALLAQKKPDEAIAEYRIAIKLNPRDADSHHALREALRERGNQIEATAKAREAIRLKPGAPATPSKFVVAALENGKAIAPVAERHRVLRVDPQAIVAFERGHAWLSTNDFDKAIAELDQAIRIQPGFAEPYVDRGFARSRKGDYSEAIANYEKAIGLDPQNLAAYNFRGWLWATCPDGRYRDGNKALESAIWACALSGWHDAFPLATLAAAYAETSDFRAAAKSQTKAIRFLTDLKQKDDFCMRLELYRAKKAYHQPAP